MELRARDGKATLCGRDEAGEHEIDPDRLPLGVELSGALHEWAQVADAVGAIDGDRDNAGSLVSRRGRQLAGRIAEVMGVPIDYADPVTGEVRRVDVAAKPEPARQEPARQEPAQREFANRMAGEPTPWTRVQTPWTRVQPSWGEQTSWPPEPTPWATGLTVTAFTAVIVVIAVLALATALNGTSPWLSMIANLVVTAGLAPSVVLAKRVPVWRWVAYGVVVGLALAWLGWLLSLL